jgi:ketosteroid isomerase-like protein
MPAATARRDAMEGAKQEILRLEGELVDAFNEGDIDRVLTYFDPELTGFSSTQHMRLASLDELRKTFEYYISQAPKVDYIISDPHIRPMGDMALLTFYWAVRMRNGKKRKPIEGRGTHVFLKKNGAWKIVHEHFSRAHRKYEK